MAPIGFFSVTRNAHDAVTDLYDFVWPATAAVWNLRWQVKGYLIEYPEATEEQLRARFAHPTGVGSNYRNFRNGFASASWVDHEARIASFLLVALIGEYEAWARAVLFSATGSEHFADKNEKGLQFPTTAAGGVRATIQKALARRLSSRMQGAYSRPLSKQQRYADSSLDDLLFCFRYFKEARNALAHGGGVAPQRLVDAASEYTTRTGQLGMTHAPACPPLAAGDRVRLTLRQVSGLGEVILRLMTTIDAHLATSVYAERALIEAWKAHHGSTKRFLPADEIKRRTKVASSVARLGFPKPLASDDIPELLKERNLVFF